MSSVYCRQTLWVALVSLQKRIYQISRIYMLGYRELSSSKACRNLVLTERQQ